MGKEKTTQNGSTSATLEQTEVPIVLSLPESLVLRIRREYQLLAERQQRLQAETETNTRALLEGYMAAFQQTTGKNFNLSDDKTCLIEVT